MHIESPLHKRDRNLHESVELYTAYDGQTVPIGSKMATLFTH